MDEKSLVVKQDDEAEEATSLPPMRMLSNGSIQGEHGKFLPGIKPTTAIGSSERGRELAARRVEVAKAKARKGLVEAYEQHTGKPGGRSTDAYGEMAGEFARSALANAMGKPREAVEAGKFSLRLADMLPADDKRAQAVAAVQVVIAADVDARLTRQLEGLDE